ncbi:hypothetical protein TSUD_239860 [Trifolium subterraneum]|uniref:Uncharacterized protein n=1 Tax=Trifolium subterraneum TaxID=3900 RepID=A0A2Z6PKY2_TRISU|nr:hypothetical protein TSUD_239860 [Trifolium subterraneum]
MAYIKRCELTLFSTCKFFHKLASFSPIHVEYFHWSTNWINNFPSDYENGLRTKQSNSSKHYDGKWDVVA